MTSDVNRSEKFETTPKDGRWHELPNDLYIRWNLDLDLWDYMKVRDGKVLDHGHVPQGTKLA